MKIVKTAPKKDPRGNTKIISQSKLIILPIKKISDNKFIVGGAAILAALSIKIISLKIGRINNNPLLI
jgi:hypothetical protein